MRIRRDVASIPRRSAAETWRAIVDLVTGDDTIDRDQLDSAASVIECLIADEMPATVPIVFKGSGPRVLIYCLFNEDAMEAGLDVDPLSFNPTAGDWRATAPSEEADVTWMNNSLKKRAQRITVHSVDEQPSEDDGGERHEAKAFEIDWGSVNNP
jgi:hypothetical protein